MQNLSTIHSSSNFPVPLPAKVRTALEGFERALDGREIEACRAPSPEQRSWLTGRVEALRASLVPCSERDRDAEIDGLFAVLAMRDDGETAAAVKIATYRADLADLPAAALREACRHFRMASKFVPAISEIRQEANQLCAPWRKELGRIESVLSAKVVANKKYVDKTKLDGLLAELRATTARDAITPKRGEAA
jgi:hypothetical protein